MADEPTGPFRVKDKITGHEYTSTIVFDGLEDVTTEDNPALDASGNFRGVVYAEPEPAKQLADLTVDELKAHAEEVGADLTGASKKAEIVAAIEAKEAQS